MKLDLINEKIIHYFGRNKVEKDCITFFNTCSGFTFDFIGTKVIAKFISNPLNLKLRILVDDDKIGKLVFINTNGEYVLVDNLVNGPHTIKVFKCNSEEWGVLSLLEIDGPESYLEYQNKYDYKFEFFGDSITAGYGINSIQGGDSTENEDGTLTYAKRVCDYFNAEPRMLAQSGISLAIPVWHDWIMYDRYKYYSVINYQVPYDFTKYNPDFVFINLGTNDSAGVNKENSIIYKDTMYQMVHELRELYPQSYIIVLYGMMGVNPLIKNGIEATIKRVNDKKIMYKEFHSGPCSGWNGHPSKENAIIDANELIAFLIPIIN